MHVRHYIAATIIAALGLLAGGCVYTDYSLGGQYVPDEEDILIRTVDIDIPVGLKLADSLQTSSSYSAVVGSMYTEEFGGVHISTALTITPLYDSIRWGVNPVFKSMYVSLAPSSTFTMQDDQKHIPQNFYVYQLNRQLDSTDMYCNSIRPGDYGSQQVNSGTCLFMGDTTVLRFTEAFGSQLFEIDTTALDSTALFLEKFHGIYIACDRQDEGCVGGRINHFDLSGSYATMQFTSTNDAGIRRDTTVYFSLGASKSVLSIEAGRKDDECDDATDVLLYQGYNGVKPYINGTRLRQALDLWLQRDGLNHENVLITHATMEFPFEYTGDPDQLSYYPTSLYPHLRASGSGYTVYTPISEIYNSSYDNGSINRSLSLYRPDVALYLQNLIRKKVDEVPADYDIYMMSTISYTTTTSSASSSYYSYYYYYYYGYDPTETSTTYYYADTKNYAQGRLNGTRALRHPKLHITYTVLR